MFEIKKLGPNNSFFGLLDLVSPDTAHKLSQTVLLTLVTKPKLGNTSTPQPKNEKNKEQSQSQKNKHIIKKEYVPN